MVLLILDLGHVEDLPARLRRDSQCVPQFHLLSADEHAGMCGMVEPTTVRLLHVGKLVCVGIDGRTHQIAH